VNVLDVIVNQINPPAPDKKETKAFRYRCTEKCVFQGRFRREGEIILLPEKKEVPHFEFVPEKEGA